VSIRTKGVGFDDHCPGLHILSMYVANETPLDQIELIKTSIYKNPTLKQHGSHRPIEHDRCLFLQDIVKSIIHVIFMHTIIISEITTTKTAPLLSDELNY
jgi:hypothetical protein